MKTTLCLSGYCHDGNSEHIHSFTTRFSFLKAFALVVGMVMGNLLCGQSTYTWTAASGNLQTSAGPRALNEKSWNQTAATYIGWDANKGIQIGSSNNPTTSFSLTTNEFSIYTITEIIVNSSIAKDGTAKLNISVDGTNYMTNQALTTTNTAYSCTPNASGNIVVSWTNTAKAFYVKSIAITYTSSSFTYSVTYSANGATSGAVPTDNASYSSGATVSVLGNTGSLAKTGYSFSGWNTAADGTGTDRAVGSTFSITSNTTLYAKWVPNQYNVEWIVNGTSVQSGAYNYGTSISVPSVSSSVCDGKVFVGWTENSNYSNEDAPSDLFNTTSYTISETENKIFYAVFAERSGSYEWRQVTTLEDITAGLYVIVSNGFYLPNTGTGSTDAPAAISLSGAGVTISGGVLEGTISAEMQWQFSGTNTAMTIRPNIENTTYYLYEINDNKGIRVHTTSDTWAFSVYTTGTFYMRGANKSRYCATYNSQDWRSYTTYNHGNYGDEGKVYLYKYSGGASYFAYSTTCTTCEHDAVISQTALNFSAITATSITATAPGGITSFGEDCYIRSYGFVYSTSANPTLANGVKVVGTSYSTVNTPFQGVIEGLEPCTTYHVRAYATNGHGTVYGSDCTVTTDGEAVDLSGLASINGETFARLSWVFSGTPCYEGHFVVICKEGSGDIISSCDNYDFTTIEANTNFGSGTQTYSNEYAVYSGDETVTSITGLTEGTTYTAAVFFVDNSGNCILREQISFVYNSVTLLDRGDLAIVGVDYNIDMTINGTHYGGDEISFVIFKSITKGTTIEITDNGYERKFEDLWGTSEGILRFTWNDNTPLPKGSYITVMIKDDNITSASNLNESFLVYVNGQNWTSKWQFAFEGNKFGYNQYDQIWIMQGGEWVSDETVDVSDADDEDHYHNKRYTGNVLYGFTATGWKTEPGYNSTQGSTLYPGCECYKTDITFNPGGQVKYKGDISTLRSKYEWIGLINDISNWENFTSTEDYHNDAVYDFSAITERLPISDEIPTTNTWAGYKDHSWCNCANWYYLIVPDESTDVTIPEIVSPRMEVNIPAPSEGTVECKTLTIRSGGKVASNDNNAEMSVYGDINVESGGLLNLGNTNPMTLNLKGNLVNVGSFRTSRNLSMNLFGNTAVNIDDVSTGIFSLNNLSFHANNSTFDAAVIELYGNFDDQSPSGDGLGNQEIHFVGDAQQTINNTTAISDVTINNTSAAGVVVASGKMLNVSVGATFVDGIVNGNVTFAATATSSGANINSYVDGTVTKKANASAFTFPTGSNGVLGALDVSGLGADTDLKFNHDPDGFSTSEMPVWWNQNNMCPAEGSNAKFDHVSNMYFWNLGSSSAIADAVFTVTAGEDVHFNSQTVEHDNSDISIALYDGCWKNLGGITAGPLSSPYLEISVSDVDLPATRASGDKIVTLGSIDHNTLLPIELVSFVAECKGGDTELSWTTVSEHSNDYFVLERSYDAVNFTEVARVAGAGNSISPTNYSHTVYGGGSAYYRLVQVDYDGTSTVSEMIAAECNSEFGGEPEVVAYPNPFDGDLTLRFENFGGRKALVEVFDMLGRLVASRNVVCLQNDYELVLSLGGLPDGAYNVRVSTEVFVVNKNVVKQ